ncbi:MAG: PilZ domain-containing protein [Deltaproteobacteria bacterium]|nr:PilZ domain-containing protein [Deltaproteobacteria bacterium]MDQ3299242.1 PilZ domain-containing protein [Myxococcota bacterium]
MDKREAVRVPVRARAQCRCSGIVIDGLVEDVSRSGLFLRAPKWIRSGSVAELALDLPGEETLQLSAEVVRVEHSDDRAGMAFKFVEDPDQNRSLANFIMRHHEARR